MSTNSGDTEKQKREDEIKKKYSKKKDIIFLAYANSEGESLKHLETEYKNTLEVFETESESIEVQAKFGIKVKDIIDFILAYKNQIIAFQFSGHANKDTIILEDDEANSYGVIKFLAQCPKLQLIILNGCSTKEQAEMILKVEQLPAIVISTSAPVSDLSASRYAATFWDVLYAKKDSYLKSHNAGLAAAEILKGEQKIIPTRNAGFSDSKNEGSVLWDISTRGIIDLDDKLPITFPEYEEPNKILREQLLNAFSIYDEEVAAVKIKYDDEKEDKRGNLIHDINTVILQALPLSISEQIRKLFAKRSKNISDQDHVFYDEYDEFRLTQIIKAYNTLIETITFIHLSQFWEINYEAKQKNIVLNGLVKDYSQVNNNKKVEIIELVTQYFKLTKEEKIKYSELNLCHSLNEFFVQNGNVNFLEEWNANEASLKENKFLNEGIAFMLAILQNLEGYDLPKYDLPKIVTSCIEGERYLATVYSKLAFIVKYKMISIQGTDVRKYRNEPEKDEYFNNYINLVSKFKSNKKGYSLELKENEKGEKPRFNHSVFIENTKRELLNLTPFIIDENSFNKKPILPRICHFSLVKPIHPKGEKYSFSHVYESKKKVKELYDETLDIMKDKKYSSIKDQLTYFKIYHLNLKDEK